MSSNHQAARLRRAVGSAGLIGGGLVVAAVSISHGLPREEPFVGRLLSMAALLGLALPLVVSGVWLWRRESDGAQVWRVTGWALAGMIPITVLSLLTVYYQRVEGVRLAETWTIVTWVAGTGTVGGLLTGLYDLRRERARQDARMTADRLETIVETIPVPLLTLSAAGTVVTWNAAAEEVFGWTADEVEGEPLPLIPDDEREVFEDYRRQVRAGDPLRGVETQGERKDGSRVDVQIWATPRFDSDGAVEEAVVAFADISELKERERALQTLHEAGRDLVRARTVDEVFERAIDAADQLFSEPIAGCWRYDEPTDELQPICQTPTAAAQIGDQPVFEAGTGSVWDAYASGEPTVYDDVRDEEDAYGGKTPVRSELILSLGEFGAMVIAKTEPGAFDDLDIEIGDALAAAMETALERAEHEANLRLFKRAVEEAGHAIMITDADGTIEYVNPRFAETTGYSQEEARGENPRLLKSGKHDSEFYEDLWETILSGEEWDAELVNQRKDGRLYRAEETIAPITGEEESITHFVGLQREITQRRLREQQLDVLNRVLRHNLRNALNVVLGRASRLKNAVEETTVRSQANVIQGQAADLLEISEKAGTVQRIFDRDNDNGSTRDIEALLADCMPAIEADYPEASITWTAPKGVHVQADDYLELAIREAIDNAVVHNDANVPEVAVSVTPPAEHDDGYWVEVVIADNGTGIPVDEWAMIERGEETSLIHGSGIGLWLIRWVVASFGGEVTIDDNEMGGSTVVLRVPAASDE